MDENLIIFNIIKNEVMENDIVFNDYDMVITIIFDNHFYDSKPEFNLGVFKKRIGNRYQKQLSTVFFIYDNAHITKDAIIYDLSKNLFNNIKNTKWISKYIKNKKIAVKVITNTPNPNTIDVKYNFRFYVPLTIKRAWDYVFNKYIDIFMIYNN